MVQIIRNADGSPFVAPVGLYPSFNSNENPPIPGVVLNVKKGVLRQNPYETTISPYQVKTVTCLEINFPFCFVEIVDNADRSSWYTFTIHRDSEGHESINTGRVLVNGINDNKSAARNEFERYVAEFEEQQRNAAALKEKKAQQHTAASARNLAATELKSLRLKAKTDLKETLKGLSTPEILKSKEVQSLCDTFNKLDAILNAL
jgi:hypothetical protein